MRPDKFAMYFDFKETIVKPQIKQDKHELENQNAKRVLSLF
jgi:hypothetical protein